MKNYPTQVTVCSLLAFLTEELASKRVTLDTPIYVETFALTEKESKDKLKEDELDYHVPDRICDESSHFSCGTWIGPSVAENWIALSIYPSLKDLV